MRVHRYLCNQNVFSVGWDILHRLCSFHCWKKRSVFYIANGLGALFCFSLRAVVCKCEISAASGCWCFPGLAVPPGYCRNSGILAGESCCQKCLILVVYGADRIISCVASINMSQVLLCWSTSVNSFLKENKCTHGKTANKCQPGQSALNKKSLWKWSENTASNALLQGTISRFYYLGPFVC